MAPETVGSCGEAGESRRTTQHSLSNQDETKSWRTLADGFEFARKDMTERRGDPHTLGCTLTSLGMKDLNAADGIASRPPIPSAGFVSLAVGRNSLVESMN